MATASVPTEPSEKECSVCHEPFTEPKLLPCGHLMCRHCLLSWLKTQKDAKCPLCRGQIVEAEVRGKKSLEEIADGFPTDLAMKMVVDADRVLNKGHSCCVCEDVAATALCLTCGDMLCETCAKAHRKMSMLKYHRVEDLSSLTAEDLAASRPETCPVHADRTSELFCPTHGAAICSLCATISHRSCPEVTSLETKMEEARAVLAELAAMLSAGETELERGISQLDQHLQETEKRTRAAIAEVEAMCDRLESAVKACRRRLTELAQSASSDVREAVQEGKTCLLNRRGKLTTHKRVTQRAQEIKTMAALSSMASVMTTRVNDLDRTATLPSDAKVVSSVTLIIDTEAVTRMEQTLSELGQVKTVPAGNISQVRCTC